MGDYHAGFLGGLGAAMPPGYPVFDDSWLKVKNPSLRFFNIS
jgi:hypothetical protein